MFLDAAALRQLTGFARKARQIERLRAMGVPFWINGRGVPVVCASALEASKPPQAKPTASWSPSALSSRS